jgi:hypothetical protein
MCFVSKKKFDTAIDEFEEKFNAFDVDLRVLESKVADLEKLLDGVVDSQRQLTIDMNHYHPEPEPAPDYFDPKAPKDEWPTEIDGQKVGYVRLAQEAALVTPDKDNVLYPYENNSWADNTLGKRVQAKAGRWLMVFAKGENYRYGDPRPFEFDGGAIAWRVMNEQSVDGKYLWDFEHPHLYVKHSDADLWEMPE